jgi:Leucine-rich repeat (LRR) protein
MQLTLQLSSPINTSLHRLYLYDNALSGTIPPQLGNLSSLQNLFLGKNALSGTIPFELTKLLALSHLSLSSNTLSSTIPEALTNLTQVCACVYQLSETDLFVHRWFISTLAPTT